MFGEFPFLDSGTLLAYYRSLVRVVLQIMRNAYFEKRWTGSINRISKISLGVVKYNCPAAGFY